MLAPYDYWQYFRNTEDADVGRFLRLFTALPLDEVAKLEALDGADLNDAKKILATEATAMVHGREAADEANVPFDVDIYTLNSGQTRTFRFAAYAPTGQASRFTFQMDPTVTNGSGTINWTNQSNPYCSGDISDL